MQYLGFLHFFTHTGWCKLFHFLNFVELWVCLKITKNLKAISINFSSSLFLSFPVCTLLKNITCLYLFSIGLGNWLFNELEMGSSINPWNLILNSLKKNLTVFARFISLVLNHCILLLNRIFWSNFRYRCEVQFLSTACILGSYVVNVVYDA